MIESATGYFPLLLIIASFLIFLVPSRIRRYYALAVTLLAVLLTSVPAVQVLMGSGPRLFSMGASALPGSLTFSIDGLTAFFILVTDLGVLMGLLYGGGYLKKFADVKTGWELALHYFCYLWLHFSMLGVLMLRDGLPFLISWELMSVSSFVLVLFEAEKRTTLKTAVTYLMQMHVGFMLLVIAFLIAYSATGLTGFEGLRAYFGMHRNPGLFLLLFAGFGIKAGFIPLHTWLPGAHPAAPSHVSGVMSGVMIKMGIFGILRVITCLQHQVFEIGVFILAISTISGLAGVMMAIVQHDLKKLLAYHSIENIGIIGMGLGLGTIGAGTGQPILVLLGFGGGLLHVLNHSLFKPLLFYSAGSVYQQYHTRQVDELGGVIHKMPYTAGFFLTGSLAICGLPPLNGFISELLIYIGLFKGLPTGSFFQSVALMMAVISLAVIGGLALFCFTKAFGVVFLGTPRKHDPEDAKETGRDMLLPQWILAFLIAAIGLFPLLFLKPVILVIEEYFPGISLIMQNYTGLFARISQVNIVLLSVIAGILALRALLERRRRPVKGLTWGCGYRGASARHQYTGTSFVSTFSDFADPLLNTEKQFSIIPEEELFPAGRYFVTHPADVMKKGLDASVSFIMWILKKLARLQTGHIQHYILYAFIYIFVIFILLYLSVL